MDGAVVQARLDGGIDQAVLLDAAEAGHRRRDHGGGEMVPAPLVDDLPSRPGERLADHPLELGQVRHPVRISALDGGPPGPEKLAPGRPPAALARARAPESG